MKSFYSEAPMIVRYGDQSWSAAIDALQRMSPHARGTLVLFSGLKTSQINRAAEAVATRLKLDLRRVDLKQVVSKYTGETEKNLRELFKRASHSNTVLFFDEADALFGKRTNVKDAHDRYANLEVSRWLRLLDGYQGIVMLTVRSSTPLVRARNRRRLVFVSGD